MKRWIYHCAAPLKSLCIALSFGVTVAPGAMADDKGEELYATACAICHGIMGDGGGYYREFLNVEPGKLTNQSAANDGEFPMDYVLSVINGEAGVRAHGSKMPIWGTVFKTHLNGQLSDEETEVRARGLILSLAYYLRSIQD